MEKKFRPTFGAALLILGFLVVSMGISVLWLDIPLHITMVFSAAFAVLVLMIQGCKWDEISEAIVYSCSYINSNTYKNIL